MLGNSGGFGFNAGFGFGFNFVRCLSVELVFLTSLSLLYCIKQ